MVIGIRYLVSYFNDLCMTLLSFFSAMVYKLLCDWSQYLYSQSFGYVYLATNTFLFAIFMLTENFQMKLILQNYLLGQAKKSCGNVITCGYFNSGKP